jgi:hyperosmotically inducible periplasmic protein
MKMNRQVVVILAMVAIGAVVTSASGSAAPQSTGENIKSGASKTKNAVVKGAKVVGGKTKDGVSKSGEVMTDGWITSRVHARFVNEDTLKGSRINVDTRDHIVTLNGTVVTSLGFAKAGVIARQTEGVQRVVNNLTVTSKQ